MRGGLAGLLFLLVKLYQLVVGLRLPGKEMVNSVNIQ